MSNQRHLEDRLEEMWNGRATRIAAANDFTRSGPAETVRRLHLIADGDRTSQPSPEFLRRLKFGLVSSLVEPMRSDSFRSNGFATVTHDQTANARTAPRKNSTSRK